VRERAGTVAEADYARVRDAVMEALEGVQDESGRPAFSRILRHEELGELHLDAPAAGDLIVQAAPGFALSDALGSSQVLGGPEAYGQAGYEPTWPEMQAMFLAAGRGIRPATEVGPVHILDLVPTLTRLLALQPQAEPAGRPLEEMLLP
jgi:predicted AlkP superfamily phosphohydrolase/phosphomutase